MPDPTVASIFLKLLKKHGIRHIFGLPTIQLGMMQDGFGKDPWFSFVTTRHEESTGHMAAGVARSSDELALCFATVGTGVANMLPGVAAANADSVPMLAVTSNNHLRLIEPAVDYLQTVDQLALFKPITKWGAGLRQAERTVEVLEKAIYKARFGCPGPVQIDVPFDLHTYSCNLDVDATPVMPVPRPIPSAAETAQVVEKITAAKRPLLIAGGGIARSGAVEQFRELVKITGAAAITTNNSYGVITPECETGVGNSGFFGGYGLVKACREADLIVAFGCRFSLLVPVNKPLFPPVPGQEIIQIDIDPEQLGQTVPTNFGLVGDARETLTAINNACIGRTFNNDRAWIAALLAERDRFRAEVTAIADQEYISDSDRLNEAAIARAVVQELPDNAIVAVDGGQCMEWTHTWFHPKDPYHFLFNAGMGHLGAGLPMAMGAKLANPEKPVICMTGDGAFGMTIQELETAVRYRIQLVIIIYNDSRWGMYERPNRSIFHNENFGTVMGECDYATIARGFGCNAENVRTLPELSAAVRRGLSAEAVTVIDVATDYTPHPMDEIWRPMNTSGADLRPVEL